MSARGNPHSGGRRMNPNALQSLRFEAIKLWEAVLKLTPDECREAKSILGRQKIQAKDVPAPDQILTDALNYRIRGAGDE